MTELKKRITSSGKNPPKFREKGHKYKKGKDEYTSVTKFVHSFFSEFDAKAISKYVAKSRRAKGEKITATQVRKEWTAIADAGTDTHKQVYEYILDDKTPQNLKAKAAVMFLEDMGFVDKDKYFLNSELMVWSDEHKLCGTSDLVIEDGTNGLSLADWKTNKSIVKTSKKKGILPPVAHLDDCNYIQYTLQLSVYAYILETEFGFDINNLYLVHLLEGMYIRYDVPYLKDVVVEMIKWKHQNNKSDDSEKKKTKK